MQFLTTRPGGKHRLDLHCDACGAQYLGCDANRPYRAESDGRAMAKAAGWHVHHVRVLSARHGAGEGIFTAHYCPAHAADHCVVCDTFDWPCMATATLSDEEMRAWSDGVAQRHADPIRRAPDAVRIEALRAVVQARSIESNPVSAGA